MQVHGEAWTLKELFVYPNEQIYWSVQIVLYPYLTGLVAGAFVLSSLYHVFGREELKPVAKFSLIFSFVLLMVAPMTLLFHLQHPERGFYIFFTPHFTSAIAAFGIVFFVYTMIVASEIWFSYRKFIVESALESALALGKAENLAGRLKGLIYRIMTIGSYDISEKALETDEKMTKILAGIGIPVACFLHGYAGFIFGSVKANALWMTPLMPIIFIMSAIVSGIALCIFTYILIMEIRLVRARKTAPPYIQKIERETDLNAIRTMAKYLVFFMIIAVTLELLDMVFHSYTAKKPWEIISTVIFDRFAFNIFGLQYGLGMLVPFILLLIPRLSIGRAFLASTLVLIGVFMMRWNVVIGGQSFSLTHAGYMNYVLPVIPHDIETFKEGLFGMILLLGSPFLLLWVYSKIFPLFPKE
ncbi:MAG: polysulfide reductase NrfD [Nitrospirae bacterium]|nr:polysulfide reductase NrfD [Nitrospirota bacterium]